MTDLNNEIDNAMKAISKLSNDARAAAELPLMYAANRAWRELDSARYYRADQR